MPQPSFAVPIAESPPTELYAERLRDGRVVLGTRAQGADGGWAPAEMHVLERSAFLGLAAWLADAVADEWIDPVRARQDDQLAIAAELYGAGPDGVRRLAEETLREIPTPLLVRALLLLLNALGPEMREQRVALLNRTPAGPAEAELRRRLADEREAVAYAVAAAALLDALDRGLPEE